MISENDTKGDKELTLEPADPEKETGISETSKRQLKKERSVAKGAVTRKRNDVNGLLADAKPDADKLNAASQLLDTAIEKFVSAHKLYHESLHAEGIEESNEYPKAEVTRVNDLRLRIANVIETVITAEDSVSNLGKPQGHISKASKVSHKSSTLVSSSVTLSSLASARAKAAAKKAALQVEAEKFQKLAALEEEELRLKHRNRRSALKLSWPKQAPRNARILK